METLSLVEEMLKKGVEKNLSRLIDQALIEYAHKHGLTEKEDFNVDLTVSDDKSSATTESVRDSDAV